MMKIFIRATILILIGLLSCYQLTNAKGMGRLFTTPQERAVLDAERSKPHIPPPSTKGKQIKKPSLPDPPHYITFNGLITRSQGSPMVWFNGSNKLFQPGFKVELDKMLGISVPIFLSKAKQRIWLKPGQTVNTLDGTIQENFE